MKRIKLIIACLLITIKNKFFKSQKTDISHSCKKALDFKNSDEDLNQEEEYQTNYNVTTRWQTL